MQRPLALKDGERLFGAFPATQRRRAQFATATGQWGFDLTAAHPRFER
ncbi:hypothetical protein [Candidatus Thiodictyon syntrophicum]|jgi:hypothetical protein|nr:hypothetical protein [Candidatus Thiodictyon syntrophicum]